MNHDPIPVFYPRNTSEWGAWLERYGAGETAVWVVFATKATGRPTISWSEAVDVALCWGWIDSKKVSLGDGWSQQFFTRRKPGSGWSKINKDKVERLVAEGRMQPAGLAVIEAARADGSWNLFDGIEALVVPPDLLKALRGKKGARAVFDAWPKSLRKILLHWVMTARRAETRTQRITTIVQAAAEGKRPAPFGGQRTS